MTLERVAGRSLGHIASVAGLIGAAASIVAAAAIWLLLTEPVTIASAVETGELSVLVRELADIISKAVAGLLEYL